MRKATHGDFKLRRVKVRIRVLALGNYSIVFSCSVRKNIPGSTHLKRVSQKGKQICEHRSQVATRGPWPPSFCLFMEEFTLSFEDSIYHVEAWAQKTTKISHWSHDIWLTTHLIQWGHSNSSSHQLTYFLNGLSKISWASPIPKTPNQPIERWANRCLLFPIAKFWSGLVHSKT